MTAAHYKGGHPPGNDLGLHYTPLPPIVASCPYSDQLLVTRKFWSPGANRPSQAKRGLRGYPVATAALYGPDDPRATKLTVGIVPAEDGDATHLRRWFAEGDD